MRPGPESRIQIPKLGPFPASKCINEFYPVQRKWSIPQYWPPPQNQSRAVFW